MQPEIAHVPMNLHLQQLLVSTTDDPPQSIKLIEEKKNLRNLIVTYIFYFRINL